MHWNHEIIAHTFCSILYAISLFLFGVVVHFTFGSFSNELCIREILQFKTNECTVSQRQDFKIYLNLFSYTWFHVWHTKLWMFPEFHENYSIYTIVPVYTCSCRINHIDKTCSQKFRTVKCWSKCSALLISYCKLTGKNCKLLVENNYNSIPNILWYL